MAPPASLCSDCAPCAGIAGGGAGKQIQAQVITGGLNAPGWALERWKSAVPLLPCRLHGSFLATHPALVYVAAD